MKLSHLKTIIKESIKELNNKKQSLNEAEECPGAIVINCDTAGTYGSWTCGAALESTDPCTYGNCCGGGQVDPRGGGREPMGPSMG